jgi:hypothetical protein
LDVVPQKNADWDLGDENRVRIKRPKFRNQTIQNLLTPFMNRPDYSVNLDEIGSATWQEIDGNQTIYQISLKLKAQFGERIEPVFERTGEFFRTLHASHLVRYIDE